VDLERTSNGAVLNTALLCRKETGMGTEYRNETNGKRTGKEAKIKMI
jgi:hypothetical protein